jgi:protein-L-isoaspartate(D-aspartate) O-methyltransferase
MRGTSRSLDELRQAMVEEQIVRRGIHDERVVNAIAHVPRHEFVAEEYRNQAYEDRPLGIGEGQTISQPYIVAVSLAALAMQSSDVVLELGTGSGYQTALLAEIAFRVYSIERHSSLAESAAQTLARLEYSNIEIKVTDGAQGWSEKSPFDAIVVAAAAPRIPEALFAQLREGGRMVIPVGPEEAQDLQLVRKQDGQPMLRSLSACRFVPLIGEGGYQP